VAVTNPRAGQGGRPRTFQDVDFFNAVNRTIGKHGYTGVTLDAIADELGCTAAAVSRRFGSKHGLVRAYLEWRLESTARRYREARKDYASPLAALRVRGTIPAEERPDELGDPSDPTYWVNRNSFFTAAGADPEFLAILRKHYQISVDETAGLLRDAIDAGELKPANPVILARTIISAWSGTTNFWGMDGPDGTLIERLGEIFDTIIDPYRTTPRG
jgi:AcrR family transcriptional regulator